jgi:hypothetical protein
VDDISGVPGIGAHTAALVHSALTAETEKQEKS